MSILDELLEECKSSDLDEKIKIICDKIMSEEVGDLDEYQGPQGPNIFLSILSIEDKKFQWYLTLEREFKETYTIRHWKKKRTDISNPIPIKTFDNKEAKPKPIIKRFVSVLKFVRGE